MHSICHNEVDAILYARNINLIYNSALSSGNFYLCCPLPANHASQARVPARVTSARSSLKAFQRQSPPARQDFSSAPLTALRAVQRSRRRGWAVPAEPPGSRGSAQGTVPAAKINARLRSCTEGSPTAERLPPAKQPLTRRPHKLWKMQITHAPEARGLQATGGCQSWY